MVVNVQTCGLHRRSMNAPTMLIYKYIYLWPTKINHGYTVGTTIGRLISNYLNYFSYINQQPKQIARQALFGKESCQRSWLRDWIISAHSPTPSWLTAKLYINYKFVKANKKADDFYHLLSLAPTARLAASGHAGKTVHCTVFFFRLSLRFRSVHQLHLD